MKLLVVMGTRPEAIKLAPLIELLKKHIEVRVCSTGQHREMLTQALEAFKIKPDWDLQVISEGQSLNILSSKIFSGMDVVLKEYRPDWVIVQGDTTSALCAALAAFNLNIKVAHVEAGLRTLDLKNPFPEEGNRAMLARVADIHFAPTQNAKMALIKEGVKSTCIIVTGNTIVDSIQLETSKWVNGEPKHISDDLKKTIDKGRIILVTCHRRENFGDIILNIAHMIKRLASKHEEYQWIFPLHFNPEVREPVMKVLKHAPNVLLIDPVDYESSLFLISKSKLVITDSGGIQEEAPSFGVPVVVMRSSSERMEGLKAGFAKLAGQDSKKIEMEVEFYLQSNLGLSGKGNPYGDGKASERIWNYFLGKVVSEFNG